MELVTAYGRMAAEMASMSVRARTTMIAVALFAIAVVVAAIGLTLVLQSSLLDEIDRSIDSRAADIAAQVDSEAEFISLGAGIDADTFAVVFSADGAIFDSSDTGIDVEMLLTTFDVSDTPFNVSLAGLEETAGSDNMRAVVLVVPFDLDASTASDRIEDEDFIIYVATSLDGLDRTVDRVTIATAIAGSALIVLVGLLTWLLAGRALAPVEAIRAEVSTISATDLHRRVTQPRSRDEVARLAETMNEMLDRLDRAQQAQRQFVADASHELRSPLASMVARLDVVLRHGDEAEWQSTATALRADSDRMSRLVADLLLLARSDDLGDDVAQPANKLVDVDDIVTETVRETRCPVGVTIDVDAVSGAVVRGNPDELRRLMSNLLANAARHASSAVGLAVSESNGSVVLAVSDDGPGIAEADRERIFDRFVRLDEARTRDGGGSGLGLAISRDIARRHGGDISIGSSPNGGSVFSVDLPSA